MKGAGLTQGGFYKQFESKDDLAALASRLAMESSTGRWSTAAASTPDPLEAIIRFYLSKDHRGEKGDGCPLVALGSDVARRQSEEVKLPFSGQHKGSSPSAGRTHGRDRGLGTKRQSYGHIVAHGGCSHTLPHPRRSFVARRPQRSCRRSQAYCGLSSRKMRRSVRSPGAFAAGYFE